MSCKVPTINPQPDPTYRRRDTCGGDFGVRLDWEKWDGTTSDEKEGENGECNYGRGFILAVYKMRGWKPWTWPADQFTQFCGVSAPVLPAATSFTRTAVVFVSQVGFPSAVLVLP
jgi:hypothetical protein